MNDQKAAVSDDSGLFCEFFHRKRLLPFPSICNNHFFTMSALKQSGERPILCPPDVLTLVEHFVRNRDDHKSGQNDETQLRQDLFNPLVESRSERIPRGLLRD